MWTSDPRVVWLLVILFVAVGLIVAFYLGHETGRRSMMEENEYLKKECKMLNRQIELYLDDRFA